MKTVLPLSLDPVAREFYNRFAPLIALEEERFLPAFCLLCATWSEIQKVLEPEDKGAEGKDKTRTLKYLGLVKAFLAIGKAFGLDPISAKKLGLLDEDEDEAEKKKDGFPF